MPNRLDALHKHDPTSLLEEQSASFIAFEKKCEEAIDPIRAFKKQIEMFYRFPGSDSIEAKKMRHWVVEIIAAEICVDEMIKLRNLSEQMKKQEREFEELEDEERQKLKDHYLKQFFDLRERVFEHARILLEKNRALLDKLIELIELLTKQIKTIEAALKHTTGQFNQYLEKIIAGLLDKYSGHDESRIIVVEKCQIEVTFSDIIKRLNSLKQQLADGLIQPHEFKQKMHTAIYDCIREKCLAKNINIDDYHEDIQVIVGLIDKAIWAEIQKNAFYNPFHRELLLAIELHEQLEYRKNCLELLEQQKTQIQALMADQNQLLEKASSPIEMNEIAELNSKVDKMIVAHQVRARCDLMTEGMTNNTRELTASLKQVMEASHQKDGLPTTAQNPTSEPPPAERRKSVWRR